MVGRGRQRRRGGRSALRMREAAVMRHAEARPHTDDRNDMRPRRLRKKV